MLLKTSSVVQKFTCAHDRLNVLDTPHGGIEHLMPSDRLIRSAHVAICGNSLFNSDTCIYMAFYVFSTLAIANN